MSSLFAQFYRFWHGRLHLKGAGFLLRKVAPLLRGLQAYPLTLRDGNQITLDFRDHTALYWLNFLLGDRYEEEGLVRAIKTRLNAKTIVWDVGANAGILSYLLATNAPPPKELHSFEPNPKIYAIASSALQPFPFAQTHPMALSDTTATLKLVIPKGLSGTGTVVPDKTNRHGDAIDIPCCKGDDLVFERGYTPPDLIKLDTEGHEVSVLTGITRVIATFKPAIFFEHISLTDAEITAAIPAGYALYSVGDENGSLREGLDRDRGHNSVLLPR